MVGSTQKENSMWDSSNIWIAKLIDSPPSRRSWPCAAPSQSFGQEAVQPRTYCRLFRGPMGP
jgi:hypothetical protein